MSKSIQDILYQINVKLTLSQRDAIDEVYDAIQIIEEKQLLKNLELLDRDTISINHSINDAFVAIMSFEMLKDDIKHQEIALFLLKNGANINYRSGSPLRINLKNDCANNVEFLLTDERIEHHADIDIADTLRMTISRGGVNVLNFLLTSPKIKNKPDIFANDAEAFDWCLNTLDEQDPKILNYLIWDYQIEYTETIRLICEEYREHSIIDACKLFESRTLQNSLQNTLVKQPSNKNKAKI